MRPFCWIRLKKKKRKRQGTCRSRATQSVAPLLLSLFGSLRSRFRICSCFSLFFFLRIRLNIYLSFRVYCKKKKGGRKSVAAFFFPFSLCVRESTVCCFCYMYVCASSGIFLSSFLLFFFCVYVKPNRKDLFFFLYIFFSQHCPWLWVSFFLSFFLFFFSSSV